MKKQIRKVMYIGIGCSILLAGCSKNSTTNSSAADITNVSQPEQESTELSQNAEELEDAKEEITPEATPGTAEEVETVEETEKIILPAEYYTAYTADGCDITVLPDLETTMTKGYPQQFGNSLQDSVLYTNPLGIEGDGHEILEAFKQSQNSYINNCEAVTETNEYGWSFLTSKEGEGLVGCWKSCSVLGENKVGGFNNPECMLTVLWNYSLSDEPTYVGATLYNVEDSIMFSKQLLKKALDGKMSSDCLDIALEQQGEIEIKNGEASNNIYKDITTSNGVNQYHFYRMANYPTEDIEYEDTPSLSIDMEFLANEDSCYYTRWRDSMMDYVTAVQVEEGVIDLSALFSGITLEDNGQELAALVKTLGTGKMISDNSSISEVTYTAQKGSYRMDNLIITAVGTNDGIDYYENNFKITVTCVVEEGVKKIANFRIDGTYCVDSSQGEELNQEAVKQAIEPAIDVLNKIIPEAEFTVEEYLACYDSSKTDEAEMIVTKDLTVDGLPVSCLTSFTVDGFGFHRHCDIQIVSKYQK